MKISVQKTQILIFVLSLIFASIACNTPRNAEELEKEVEVGMGWSPEDADECYSTDRDEYEYKAGMLGQAPEIPKYPESAVYEVCYIDSEVSSVRMIDGNQGTENEAEPDEELTESEESVIPDGTYLGTSDYDKAVALLFSTGGTASTNEVIVHIADDGTVSGSITMLFTSNAYVQEDTGCTDIWEDNIMGTFSGQLTGENGVIDLTEYWQCSTVGTCPTNGSCDEEPIIRQVKIQVSGNQMNGTTLPHLDDPDGLFNFSFYAEKECFDLP